MDGKRLTPTRVLADNLRVLLASGTGPTSQLGLKGKSGVAQGTIGRILTEQTAARIDTVERLAKAYSLTGWQLMVPGLDARNPPTLRAMSPEEQALYDRLRQTAQDLAKLKP